MNVTLFVVAAVAGLLILVGAAPVDVAFRVAGIDAFAGRITLRGLFGLARFCIRVPDAAKATQPKARRARKKPSAKSGSRNRRLHVMAALGDAAFRRRLYRYTRRLLRAAHARRLYLRMRLGLGDPADTGRLWAYIGPLNALARNLRQTDIRIDPEFVDPVLRFRTHGRLRLIPLELIGITVAFALAPASLRAWRALKAGHD